MKRQLFFVFTAVLTLCLTLPGAGAAKMTRSAAGSSVSADRSMDRQVDRQQDRIRERQQIRSQEQVKTGDTLQEHKQIRTQERDQKRDGQTDSLDATQDQDLLRGRQQDQQQLQVDKVE